VPKTLPTIALEDIKIASPCHASWDGMKGDDRVRHCGSCQKNVYDLSNMTRDDAEALLQKTEGRVCVRFYRRSDGTVLTQDCPVGLARVRRRLALIGAGVAAGLGLIAAFFGLRRDETPHFMGDPSLPIGTRIDAEQGDVSTPEDHPMMGAMVAPPQDEPHVVMGRMRAPDPEELAPTMGELYVAPQDDVAPVDSTG
jgi:hypothetical protein